MLLAVDSSTQWIGVALYDENMVRGEMVWQTQSRHTVELAPAVENLLKRCGVQMTAIKALAAALGPGSFTSLRIGLALIKGMALGLHLPVIGIPTLDILAAAQPLQDLPMLAVLQAGRNRLAVVPYQVVKKEWKSQAEAEVTNARDLLDRIISPTLVCGELTESDRQILGQKRREILVAPAARSLRRPGFLAELAWRRWKAGQVDDPVSLAPIYVHVAEPIPG